MTIGVCHGLSGDDHCKLTSYISVGMARKRTLTAERSGVLSIGHNLLPFTGNGEVSIRVKNSGVGQNIPKKIN